MRPITAMLWIVLLCACGGEEAPTVAPARTWSSATLVGAERLSDISILGHELFAVNDANDRALYTVDLRKCEHGAKLETTAMELKVHQDSSIHGSDPFAREGYNVSHVWPLPVEFVGIAVRPPNRLYIAERTHRIIYWGELTRGADGRLSGGRLDFAFSLRGGDRSQSAKSDWRDHGPGICGLSALRNARRVEDLYAIDRDGGTPETAGLRRLDRTGGQLGATIPLTDVNGKRPDVRGVVWEPDADRFLALVGSGRGVLIPFQDSNIRTARLGRSTPGPLIEGVTGWTSMALGDDGTLYLLSEGTPPVLAWREPDPKKPDPEKSDPK